MHVRIHWLGQMHVQIESTMRAAQGRNMDQGKCYEFVTTPATFFFFGSAPKMWKKRRAEEMKKQMQEKNWKKESDRQVLGTN